MANFKHFENNIGNYGCNPIRRKDKNFCDLSLNFYENILRCLSLVTLDCGTDFCSEKYMKRRIELFDKKPINDKKPMNR